MKEKLDYLYQMFGSLHRSFQILQLVLKENLWKFY